MSDERAPAWARRLATLRIATGLFAWVYLLVRTPHVLGLLDTPATRFMGVGFCEVFDAPPPDALVWIAVLACWVSGPAFILGWRFRLTGPAFAVAALFVLSYRNSFGMVFHTENLMVLHLLVLAVSPAASALSRDDRGGRVADEAAARWGVSLICLLTTLTYLVAGLAKLRYGGWSIDWAHGELLRAHVAFDNLRKIELGHIMGPLGPWLVRQGWVFGPLAWLTLVLELGAPLAMLSARAGQIWIALAWGFHFGVLWTMGIFFPYPLLGVGLASFLAVERLWDGERGRALERRLGFKAGVD